MWELGDKKHPWVVQTATMLHAPGSLGGFSIHGIANRGRKQTRYHHHARYLYMSDRRVLKHEDEQTTKPPPSNSNIPRRLHARRLHSGFAPCRHPPPPAYRCIRAAWLSGWGASSSVQIPNMRSMKPRRIHSTSSTILRAVGKEGELRFVGCLFLSLKRQREGAFQADS
jgi:hypothetical protein